MALFFITSDPQGLLDAYRSAITSGHVKTWIEDDDGDFTHTPPEFLRKGWMMPFVEKDQLVFGLMKRRNVPMLASIFGVYHGRFLESMLNHCDMLFTEARSSALLHPFYDNTNDTT